MSLLNQTAWVVGGVGVIGRGITKGLLKAGATVIVNSRSEERLEKLKDSLENPERLVAILGSLQPGAASTTVAKAIENRPPLNHVVAHGAVRWWARQTTGTFDHYEYQPGCDESYSLEKIKATDKLLDMSPEIFLQSSAQLASLHFSAAQQFIPRLQQSAKSTKIPSTYTFVTGDGSGKPGPINRTSMGEINSHHVWGLSAALRSEFQLYKNITIREIRVSLPVNTKETNDAQNQKLSEDIGDLVAGLGTGERGDNGRLLRVEEFSQLDEMLEEYGFHKYETE